MKMCPKQFDQFKYQAFLLLSLLMSFLFAQQGLAQNCDSPTQISSTAFFDLAKQHKNEFEKSGELVHVKIVKLHLQEGCSLAFKVKWIADNGSLNEKFYDALTYQPIKKDTPYQISQSNGSNNGPDGGGGPGSGGGGPGSGGGGSGGGGGGSGGGGGGSGGGGGGSGGGGGGSGGGN